MRIYDMEKLTKLFKDFHLLTGIKICIYDQYEQEIGYYPEKYAPFCKVLRENKEMEKRCLRCDKKAFDICKKSHEQYTYICHAGLLESVSPVLYDDVVVGYIVVGQVRLLENDRWTNEKEFKQLPEFTCLKENYEKIPVLSREKISAALNILSACAGYEYLKNILSIDKTRLDTRLAEYIDNNLQQELNVPVLCEYFQISKTELYEVFDECFFMPVASYIKKRRLEKACELLRDTRESIASIAKACGIEDYNYFSKVFHKEFHMSPTEYRKKYRD